MTMRSSSSGFTLLEVLVASILLGMLVTILTMVFNSSSIAWRTGKASVAEMGDVRKSTSGAGLAAVQASASRRFSPYHFIRYSSRLMSPAATS